MRLSRFFSSTLVVLSACGPAIATPATGSDSDESGSSSSASTTSASDTGPSSSTVTTTTMSSTVTGTDDTGTEFIGGHDIMCAAPGQAGVRCSWECDLWAQNCPRGEKCTAWANDGGNSWNAVRCVPVDEMPKKVGESCSMQESAVSGVDDCELGAMCFYVDEQSLMGTCTEFCKGSPQDPYCETENAWCSLTGDGVLSLCIPGCHPLLQDCDEGFTCVPTNEVFACAPAFEDPVPAGEPCEYVNVCEAGAACIADEYVPGCTGGVGCCSAFCDVTAPNCPQGSECLFWYEQGQAPPGYENVGVCGVMP